MSPERLILTSPAYDHRHETPNYGQHGLEFHFVVRTPEAALVFSIHTGWYIEAMKKAHISGGSFRDHATSQYCQCSYHTLATLENSIDDWPNEHCGWLNGEACQAHEPFGCTGRELTDLFFTLLTKPLDEFWLLMEKHFTESGAHK